MVPPPLNLLPAPQSITLHSGTLAADRLAKVVIIGEDKASAETGYLLEEIKEILNRPLEIASEGAGLILDMRSEGVGGKGEESFSLKISHEKAIVSGKSHRALYYGIQTIRQILNSSGKEMPCLDIEDWPHYQFRGFSDDISRRQVSTLQDFEFLIKNLSRMKVNVYQPYMEDMIFIDKHPRLGIDRGRLSRDEVASMVELGSRHFIDILPQFNSSGHCERMLELPEYAPWRFEGNLENLDPRLPEVKSFLKDVYQQLFEQFPFEYFHLGLDEARGLGHRKDLYIDNANWLADMVLNAGKKPIMWHEMFVPYHEHFDSYSATDLDNLNKDIILDQWVYDGAGVKADFLEEMISRKFQVLLSPCLHNGCCGSGTDFQWEKTNGFIEQDKGSGQVLGIHDTSWNFDGMSDRHLNWRGLAVSSYLMWRGAQPVEHRKNVIDAFNANFYGIVDEDGNEALDRAAVFGTANGGYYRQAGASVRELTQTFTLESVERAKGVVEQTQHLRADIAEVQKEALTNARHLDHMIHGLERIEAGAHRITQAPAMLKALEAGDADAVFKLAENTAKSIAELNARFTEIWLNVHKPEGLDYALRPYRNVLSELQNLPWQLNQTARRYEMLLKSFIPLDISPALTSEPMGLAALPWGSQVWDNIPWRINKPSDNSGK